MFGGSAKLKALEDELRITKLKLGEIEEERDDLKNLTLELQKVLSKFTTENKIRENENDEKVRFNFIFSQKKKTFSVFLYHTIHTNTHSECRVTSSKIGDGTHSSRRRGESETSDGGAQRGRGGVE